MRKVDFDFSTLYSETATYSSKEEIKFQTASFQTSRFKKLCSTSEKFNHALLSLQEPPSSRPQQHSRIFQMCLLYLTQHSPAQLGNPTHINSPREMANSGALQGKVQYQVNSTATYISKEDSQVHCKKHKPVCLIPQTLSDNADQLKGQISTNKFQFKSVDLAQRALTRSNANPSLDTTAPIKGSANACTQGGCLAGVQMQINADIQQIVHHSS